MQSWLAFDHYYSDVAYDTVLGRVLSNNPSKIFDFGGNTGQWSILCAKNAPQAEITILDLPGQLRLAKEHIEKQGLLDQIKLFAIDFLDPKQSFPEGPDVIWMSQFLDCFSEDEIVSILSRAAKVMGPQTDLYILETYWDRQTNQAAQYV